MSVSTVQARANAYELVTDLGERLADAMNVLAQLSAAVRPLSLPAPTTRTPLSQHKHGNPAIVYAPPPAKRNGAQAKAMESAVVPTPRKVAPATPDNSWQNGAAPSAKRTRRTDIWKQVVDGILSKAGILVTDLRVLGSYASSNAYIDRLAKSHDFQWWSVGEGAKMRYIGNRNPARR